MWGSATADTVLDPAVLLAVLAHVRGGDFTARMPLEWNGMAGKVADGLKGVIIGNQALETEWARASVAVGEQGKLEPSKDRDVFEGEVFPRPAWRSDLYRYCLPRRADRLSLCLRRRSFRV